MKKVIFVFLFFIFATIIGNANTPGTLGKFSYKSDEGYTRKITLLKNGDAIYDSVESDFTQQDKGFMRTNKGAIFVEFIFWQMWGEFGVLYDNTYYLITNTCGDQNYADFDYPIMFDPKTKTITFTDYSEQRRVIELTKLPSDQKIPIKDLVFF